MIVSGFALFGAFLLGTIFGMITLTIVACNYASKDDKENE